LILDEPTTGLDPNQIIEIRTLIKTLGKSKTVILSTHILQEVEAVCDRVMIINEGKIAAQGTTDEIAGTMKGGVTWDLTLLAKEIDVKKSISALSDKMGKLQRERVTGNDKGTVSVSFFVKGARGKGDEMAEAIFDWAVSERFKILSMQRKRLSLEDIFVRITGEEAKNE
jgi:ABC-2 type transport system ATP-binding protein